jgi:caffeoyl-CoA O-methyltransferase/O-methyltransferase
MLRPVNFSDKLLPTSAANCDRFAGPRDQFMAALYEAIIRASGIEPPERELKLEMSKRFTLAEMASNPVALRLLQMLVQMTRARRVLEIGAFIGVSTIYLAKALPPGGEVVTIEKFPEFAEICRANFDQNGVADRIRLIVGDASEILQSLPDSERFDFIFIDGNKERYAEYFRMAERLLDPGGLIIVDDALFHGDALNDVPHTEKGAGSKALLEAACSAVEYQRLLLPFANGMMLLRKPAA